MESERAQTHRSFRRWRMAAPGVQFNSEMQLTYFQPTVDQYVKRAQSHRSFRRWRMAAPSVQFNSETQLTYFQPTVDQYVKKLEQALASGDVAAAQQALAKLEKTVAAAPLSSGAGSETQGSLPASVTLQNIGAALSNGDLSSAADALSVLRQGSSSPNVVAPDNNSYADQSSATPADVEDPSEVGPDDTARKLDLRV